MTENRAFNLFSTNEQTIVKGVPAENVDELVRLRTKDLADLSYREALQE